MVQCPICEGDFSAETVRGVTLGVCARCDGLWLAAGDLDRMTKREVESRLHEHVGPPAECRYCRTPLGFGSTCLTCSRPPTIHCPRGHGQMEAGLVEVGGEEFEIDCCATCRGLWVDGHERVHVDRLATLDARERFLASLPRETTPPRRSLLLDSLDEDFFFPNSYTHGYGETEWWKDLLGALGGPMGGSGYMVGRSEPLALIIFALAIAALIFALYHYAGPTLLKL